MSISIENLSLDLPIYSLASRSLRHKLLPAMVGGSIRAEKNKPVVVRALDGISLNIEDGDRVGLFGHNGAGKTTFLRSLAGIYTPTSGTVKVQGRVSSIFDISLGMDPEATGDENVYLLGLSAGFSVDHIRESRAQILEFAELGDYINLPIKAYSAGMTMRLAFAVATSFQPDVLLMDEWIAAGDASFMQKAEARLSEMMDNASVMVLASHSVGILKNFCNKVVVLSKGKVVFFGSFGEFEDNLPLFIP